MEYLFLLLVVGLVVAGCRRFLTHAPLARRLAQHLGVTNASQLTTQRRTYPFVVALDLQRGVEAWLASREAELLGVPAPSMYESTSLTKLLTGGWFSQPPAAIEREAIDTGEETPASCVRNVAWLVDSAGERLVVLWSEATSFSGCGQKRVINIEVGVKRPVEGASPSPVAGDLFDAIGEAVKQLTTYRGKILSLEAGDGYDGASTGIKVHGVRRVERDQVILPGETIDLLDRNVIQFVMQRQAIGQRGMPTKKGLLFYGPPGTGKTHTLHYLIGELADHTTLLITAEQISLLDEYATLARLVQPTIVVIEDVDLIARSRDHTTPGEQSLLNRLLNEMDGLKPDAEVMFLLTTNRPEELEQALASRPGRVDQAIEFPLPDAEGRRKLVRLYAADAELAAATLDALVNKTEGVTASFIKELMRRALQFALERNDQAANTTISDADFEAALNEMLLAGGSLNRVMLGGEGYSEDTFCG